MPSNADGLHLSTENESNGFAWGHDSLHESDPIFNLSFDPSFREFARAELSELSLI